MLSHTPGLTLYEILFEGLVLAKTHGQSFVARTPAMGHGGWYDDPEHAAEKLVKGGAGLFAACRGPIAAV